MALSETPLPTGSTSGILERAETLQSETRARSATRRSMLSLTICTVRSRRAA
jgi:hypothetical protein